MNLLLAFFFGVSGVLVYWVATLGGVIAWYRFRKLTVALQNTLFHASARPALLQAYRNLLDRMLHD